MKKDKFFAWRRIWSPWSLPRLLQLLLGLFCLGYFWYHPAEWISIILGLALSGQAIFKQGCLSDDCNI